MILSKVIERIRLKAFFLFIIPTIGIIGSLLINNYFIGFKYEKPITKKYLTSEPNSPMAGTKKSRKANLLNFNIRKSIFVILEN